MGTALAMNPGPSVRTACSTVTMTACANRDILVSSRLEQAQISVTRNRRSARLQFQLRG